MNELAEKLLRAKRLASVIPDRLLRARVCIEIVNGHDRMQRDAFTALGFKPEDVFFRASANDSESYAAWPEEALDALIVELESKTKAYLANLEAGIAAQLVAAKDAREKLGLVESNLACGAV